MNKLVVNTEPQYTGITIRERCYLLSVESHCRILWNPGADGTVLDDSTQPIHKCEHIEPILRQTILVVLQYLYISLFCGEKNRGRFNHFHEVTTCPNAIKKISFDSDNATLLDWYRQRQRHAVAGRKIIILSLVWGK